MARKSRRNLETGSQADSLITTEVASVQKLDTAIYCRLSVENGGHETDESLLVQEKLVRDFVEKRPDLKLVDSYLDNGFTGTNFDRPEFQRLMNDVTLGKIQCIVVKDLSRFGRDYLETGHYIESVFPKLGVRLIAVTDDFDSSRPEDLDSISLHVKNLVNSIYAKDISKKIVSANNARIERGEIMGGFAPYGYLFNEDKTQYVLDPMTAPTVRMIFRWYVRGVTINEIINRLDFMEIQVPRDRQRQLSDGRNFDNGKKAVWGLSSINKILSNPVYVGDLATGRTKRAMYKGVGYTEIDEADWHVTKDTHEPIISRELFRKAEEMRKDASEYRIKQINMNREEIDKLPGVFSSLCFCGKCGGSMYMSHRSHGADELSYNVYTCENKVHGRRCGAVSVHEDFLKTVVMDQIKTIIQNMVDRKTLLEKLSTDSSSGLQSLNVKIKNLIFKISQIEDKKTGLYENLVEGILSRDDYNLMKEHYISEEQKYRTQLNEAEDMLKRITSRAARYLDVIDDFEKHLSDKEISDKLIKRMVSKIVVYEDNRTEVHFKCQDLYQDMTELLSEAEINEE